MTTMEVNKEYRGLMSNQDRERKGKIVRYENKPRSKEEEGLHPEYLCE